MTLTNNLRIHAIISVSIVLFAASNELFYSATRADAPTRFDSGRMFDRYGVLPLKEENTRLDNLATQLKNEPLSKGYVVFYEGSEDHIRDLKARACRALQHLVKRRGVDSKRVLAMLIKGGHRSTFSVELWMWPVQASDEIPRFQLGVSEKEVTIIKGFGLAKKCGRKG